MTKKEMINQLVKEWILSCDYQEHRVERWLKEEVVKGIIDRTWRKVTVEYYYNCQDEYSIDHIIYELTNGRVMNILYR